MRTLSPAEDAELTEISDSFVAQGPQHRLPSRGRARRHQEAGVRVCAMSSRARSAEPGARSAEDAELKEYADTFVEQYYDPGLVDEYSKKS